MAADRFSPLGEPLESMVSSKGFKMAVRRWPVPNGKQTKGVLVLLHGGNFHSGYFGYPGTELSKSGYEVVACDLPGHGFSEGPGNLCYYDRFSDHVDDVALLIRTEKAKRPTTPIYLFGESWGGILAAEVAIECQSSAVPEAARGCHGCQKESLQQRLPGAEIALDGVICAGSLFELKATKLNPILEHVMIPVISALFPRLTFSDKGLDETLDSAFGMPEWVAAVRSDPKVPGSPGMKHDLITFRPVRESLQAIKRINKRAPELKTPLLVVHAENDTRCGVDGARTFHANAVSADKELLVYPEASHQMFMDIDANVNRLVTDLRVWLDKRSKA